MEDYLEAIFNIVNEKHVARSRDISAKLGVNNSSVTEALNTLSRKGLINYSPYESVTMTSTGKEIAQAIARRHEVLQNFLATFLLADKKEAEETACKIEHVISPAIFEKLTRFIKFFEECPRAGDMWLEGFKNYCMESKINESCENCISTSLNELKKGRTNTSVKNNERTLQ